MSTIKDLITVISEQFASEEYIWTPNWWYLTFQTCLDDLTKDASATDLFHYENLKILIHRVLKMWSNYFEAWKVDSLPVLLTKTGPFLGTIYKTSLPLTIYSNVLYSFAISMSKANLSAETCLDMSLRTIISTLSIPAPLTPPSADVVGEKKSHAENSGQDTEDENFSDSGVKGIGLIQSYISFTKKGVTRKRGLEEDVKDLKIIVSITHCSLYNCL